MANISKSTLKKIVSDIVENNEFECDKNGQIVIKTGVYEWSDSSFHDEPEDQEVDDSDGDFLSDEGNELFSEYDDEEDDDEEDGDE